MNVGTQQAMGVSGWWGELLNAPRTLNEDVFSGGMRGVGNAASQLVGARVVPMHGAHRHVACFLDSTVGAGQCSTYQKRRACSRRTEDRQVRPPQNHVVADNSYLIFVVSWS